MSKYFIIPILFFSLSLSAQDNLLFDISKVDGNTKLIGRYPQYDKQKACKYLNFYIEDSAIIRKVITVLPLGKEEKYIFGNKEFRITLVQDFNEVKSWTINSSLNTAMYNGHAYAFDISRIKELAREYPFDYKFDKIPFNNKGDYEEYLKKQKRDESFLFDYAPQFKYEGSFEVQFPRNQKFSSPKAISEYMAPIIEKIVPKDSYGIIYTLDDKNIKNKNQYTIKFSGSKQLYEALQLGDLKKEEWKPTVEEGWFFYRTN